MLTYQIRKRVFRLEAGQAPTFPAEVEICFHFGPPQPFGIEAGGGRTGVRAAPATALFNANTGAHTIESKAPLKPLDVTIEEPERLVYWKGNVFHISQRIESLDSLGEIIESIYFALPMLLNIKFADPPIVERIDGTIGATRYRWELLEWKAVFRFTTQEEQESYAAQCWERLGVLAVVGRRRLLAALHYFHVACRLSRQGMIAGEFLAEVVLNLAKTLEVLFPSGGDGRTRDAARAKLTELGFSEAEIEGDYIPAMSLRNEIDVGHVDLGLFKQDQLSLIHAYVAHTEEAFRVLLDRVLAKTGTGEFEIEPYELGSPRSEAITVIEHLRQHANRYAL